MSVILCLAALYGCHRPAAHETFLRSDGSGLYEFDLDMSDSLVVYDVSFYTRIDVEQLAGFPMQVRWYSPSGQLYSEQVYFDYSAGPVSLYRRSCDPQEHGIWRMMVRCEAPGMRGLGLVCARKSRSM